MCPKTASTSPTTSGPTKEAEAAHKILSKIKDETDTNVKATACKLRIMQYCFKLRTSD